MDQDQDPVEVEADAPYNLSLQISGIFIIIGTSFLGMMLAFVFEKLHKKSGKGSTFHTVLLYLLQGLRGCGVGVIISTALIHLIGEAQEPFEDAGFNEIYEQWPMVFAMAGMFLMALLEFLHHRIEVKSCPILETPQAISDRLESGYEKAPPPVVDSSSGKDSSTRTIPNLLIDQELETNSKEEEGGWGRKQRNALLVEGSILIHSILIGFDLGLQNEANWIPLICAISFHQFFEGFAIGQVVIEASFGILKKTLMIFFYSITTSVGIAIGIGTYLSETYDGNSKGANITIGVLDSICGGFLLYMGMSIFWTEWFVNNPEMHRSGFWVPAVGFAGVLAGMAIMAVIGIWA
jgi:zinc transporter 1/2/3